MGPSDIKGFDKAQWQWDNMDDNDDAETEDDVPNVWTDIEEEEQEDDLFWRKHG